MPRVFSGLIREGDTADAFSLPRYFRITTANFTSTSVTPVAVSPLSVSVVANKHYMATFVGNYQAPVATTGAAVVFGASGGLTADRVSGFGRGAISSAAAASPLQDTISAIGGNTGASGVLTSGVNPIDTPHFLELFACFRALTAGSLELHFASEVASATAILLAGATLLVEQLD